MYCWGSATGSSEPTPIDGFSDVSTVAVGKTHLCAVLRNGRVRCKGANDHGQLGTENLVNVTFAVVPDVRGAIDVTAGDYATCVASRGDESELVCWGLRDSPE